MIFKIFFYFQSIIFEFFFIFGILYVWYKFINYEDKTNEINILGVVMVFSLGKYVCVYVYVGECVSQKKIMQYNVFDRNLISF